MGYVYRGNKPMKTPPKERKKYGTAECGSNAAYQAHLRKGEDPDDACYQAHLKDQAEYRARRAEAAKAKRKADKEAKALNGST